MSNTVTVTINDHIADVRLNRPDKLNALNPAMFEQLAEVAKQLAVNREVRAVVLSGEGRAFCAGLDLASLEMNEEFLAPFREGSSSYPNRFQAPAYLWKQIPAPVICALHGATFGGGLQIALGADIRIAHADSKLSLMEIKWGIIPDMSASQTLRDLVRLDVAKRLTFTGEIVSGREAVELGLATQLSDNPYQDAMTLARTIAANNPQAIALAKALYEQSWHGDSAAGLQLEETLQSHVIGSSSQAEAISSQMEKRAAQFAARRFTDFDELAKN